MQDVYAGSLHETPLTRVHLCAAGVLDTRETAASVVQVSVAWLPVFGTCYFVGVFGARTCLW